MASDRNLPRQEAKREAKARSQASRALRAEAYEALFEPKILALTGAIVSIAFLFQPALGLKGLLLLCCIGAALASGKKVSLIATIFVSLGIVAANLLVPLGKVLYQLGPLVITEKALQDGIDKAITFEGLIYISKASIRPGLKMPGRFGAIVAQAFVYYDRIVEYKGRIKLSSIFKDADELMLAVWDSAADAGNVAQGPRPKPSRAGYAIALGSVALALAALAGGIILTR